MARGSYESKVAINVSEFTSETQQESMPIEKEKGKGGRPSKGEVHKISLAIPVELYDGVEFGSYFFKGNKTAYINSLIRKDLQQNLDKYKEFKAMMEQN